jgi:hypothetical protein
MPWSGFWSGPLRHPQDEPPFFSLQHRGRQHSKLPCFRGLGQPRAGQANTCHIKPVSMHILFPLENASRPNKFASPKIVSPCLELVCALFCAN